MTAPAAYEAGGLYVGAPAKRIKDVSPEQIELILNTATRYKMYAGWY
jgi:carbonic anhydrase/acetyltransferase-like protein (isoleucine patch superfamily)